MTKEERISLFITDDMTEKFSTLQPWKKCKKCKIGYKNELELCECTEQVVLQEILSVPKRYQVNFVSPAFTQSWEKILEHRFILLRGNDLYVKLVGYFLAKKLVEQGQIVSTVTTQYTMPSIDHTVLTLADTVLFNDMAIRVADVNYKVFINKRMDDNKPIIFFNPPTVIDLVNATTGEVMDDIFDYNVDALGIKVVK